MKGVNVWRLRAGGVAWAMALVASIAWFDRTPSAHKGLVSPYTYTEHVFPILRDRCGACHFAGGAAQMSLLTYDAAAPWAEAIRRQLLSEVMPAEFGAVPEASGHPGGVLTPRELDVLLTWTAGGAPRGDSSLTPTAPPSPAGWVMGPPDLSIGMAKPHAVRPDSLEETRAFILPTNLTQSRWIRAIGLWPGAPSVVRSAQVAIEGGPTLAFWDPAHRATTTPTGTAFELPAGARLVLRINYKRNFRELRTPIMDRTQVGLYFSKRPEHEIVSRSFGSGPDTGGAGGRRSFATVIGSSVRVVALEPSLDKDYASIVVTAALATGPRQLLLLRSPRADWPRRYWLPEPVDLPAGTTVQVTAVAADPINPTASQSDGLRVSIEYITSESERRRF
jgi:hypothetical protein